MLNIKNLDSSFQVFCAFNFIFQVHDNKPKIEIDWPMDTLCFLSKYPAKRSSSRVLNTPALKKNSCKYQANSPPAQPKMTKPGVTVTHIASFQFQRETLSEGSKMNSERKLKSSFVFVEKQAKQLQI